MDTDESRHGPNTSLVGRLRLKHLELLRNIYQLRVLRRAADASFMTQPAATRLVQEMEEMFEVPLFLRDSKGMVPTPFGEALARHAGIVLADIDRMQEELMLLADGVEGRIRLGIIPSMAPRLLSTALAATMGQFPKLRYSIREGTSRDLLDLVERNELDMCFVRVLASSSTRRIEVLPVYEETFWIVCRPEHPLAQAGAGAWQCQADVDWLLPTLGTPLRELVDGLFSSRGLLRPAAKIECESFERMCQFVMDSNLLGLIPERLAAQAVAARSLHLLDADFASSLGRISLVWRREVEHSKIVRSFATAVQRYVDERGGNEAR